MRNTPYFLHRMTASALRRFATRFNLQTCARERLGAITVLVDRGCRWSVAEIETIASRCQGLGKFPNVLNVDLENYPWNMCNLSMLSHFYRLYLSDIDPVKIVDVYDRNYDPKEFKISRKDAMLEFYVIDQRGRKIKNLDALLFLYWHAGGYKHFIFLL